MTEEEFNLMVTDLTEEGVLKVSEKELIQNTIRYDDMTVANSMTKRDGITYVRKGERTESIKRMFLQTNYSRVPVVDGNLDNIIGIMYRADFYEMLWSGHKNVMSIVKPAYFVDSGEKLSVGGLNGAVKTTFIKLLCRLYDTDSGEILLDGVNIKSYDYEYYMKLFAVVFQDFKLFSLPLG